MATYRLHDVHRKHHHRDLPGDAQVFLIPTDLNWDCRGPVVLRDGLAVYRDNVGEHTARVRGVALAEVPTGTRVLAQMDPEAEERGEWWVAELDVIQARAR